MNSLAESSLAASRARSATLAWSIRRVLLTLFVLALGVYSAVAYLIRQPGYMDAYYYYGGALQLAEGKGFTEPYLWNYLDDPSGLPHPSHLYWMPLASILAAGPMVLLGTSFRAAQLSFLFLAALFPPVSFWLTSQLSGNRRHAWTSAGLALFTGFYLPFWSNVDAFAAYGLAGAACLLLTALGPSSGRPILQLSLAGACAGLAVLARADGALLAAIALAWTASNAIRQRRFSLFFSFSFLFLLTCFPWWLRNFLALGSPFPPGGLRAAWLIKYDELFSYPAELLTPARFFSQGWVQLAQGKVDGLLSNLQTVVAVQGSIFLGPFVALGLWRLRRRPEIQLVLLYFAALFVLMTFLFTFPGMRGGFFHSGAVMLPFFSTAAPIGIDLAVDWVAARRRSWNPSQAKRVFSAGATVLAAGLSFLLLQSKVIGPDWRNPAWNEVDAIYAEVGHWLDAHADAQAVLLVNNPPGFFYHARRPAIVIPNGGVETLLDVSDRYDARYILLDANHPGGLARLYTGEESSPRLRSVAQFADGLSRPVYLYEVLAP